MSDYLFLYGTLRPQQAPAEMRAIIRHLDRIGAGYARGLLYDLGEYPGAILDASSSMTIRGEVFALPTEQLLNSLDAYEDFDPANPQDSLFVRTRHFVRLTDGRELECWVYVYNREPGAAPLVTSGDYAKFKAA